MESTTPESERASVIDLILITVALIISALLSILPSPRLRAYTQGVQTSFIHTGLCLALSFTALVLAIVALLLGWFHEISFDALSGVVFALIPALFNMPADLFQHLLFSTFMWSRPSLALSNKQFCYVRIGLKCSARHDPLRWPTPQQYCQPSCPAFYFVRYSAKNLALDEPSSENRPPNTLHSDTQWYGTRIGHTTYCVQLRDHNHGPKAWWWNAIKSATWLIANPALARLDNRDRVLNALALLADIVIVGDVILKSRRDFFKSQLQNNEGVKRGVSAAPGLIANFILREIGLSEWGSITPRILRSDFKYPKGEQEEYAILFYIITEKSQLYAEEIALRTESTSTGNTQLDGDHRITNMAQSPSATPGDLPPGAADGLTPIEFENARRAQQMQYSNGYQHPPAPVVTGEQTTEWPGQRHRNNPRDHQGDTNMSPILEAATPNDISLRMDNTNTSTAPLQSGQSEWGQLVIQQTEQLAEDDVWSSRHGSYVRHKKHKSGLDILTKLLEAEHDEQSIETRVKGWVDEWLISWGVSEKSLNSFDNPKARRNQTGDRTLKIECQVDPIEGGLCEIKTSAGAEIGTVQIVQT